LPSNQLLSDRGSLTCGPLRLGMGLTPAYAESGEFDRARETAQKAITLARSARQIEWAQNIEQRLGLYNRGLPLALGPTVFRTDGIFGRDNGRLAESLPNARRAGPRGQPVAHAFTPNPPRTCRSPSRSLFSRSLRRPSR